MTKSELKSIIMECLEEEGVVVSEAMDEDQFALEQAEFVMEACQNALVTEGFQDELNDYMDGFGPKLKKEASSLYSKFLSESNGDQDEAADKVKKFMQDKYSESLKGKLAKFADQKGITGKKVGGAVAITAFIAACVTAGIALAKKNKKDNKEEEKKDEK